MRHMLAITLLIAAGPVSAQTVYKCKAADGTTVYAEKPCSTDESKVETIVVKQRPTTASASSVDSTRANFAAIEKDVARADIANFEASCINGARERIYSDANARIASHQAQIQQLRYNISIAANNLAGATWESGLREQIAGLEVSISTVRASADSQFSMERQSCMDERRRKEEEFREKYEQPKSGGE